MMIKKQEHTVLPFFAFSSLVLGASLSGEQMLVRRWKKKAFSAIFFHKKQNVYIEYKCFFIILIWVRAHILHLFSV